MLCWQYGKPVNEEVETYKLHLVILHVTGQYIWNLYWGQIVRGFGCLVKELDF